jgi:nucleoside 2-deoxyribosyltransferase
MAARVFISHAAADRPMAELVANRLARSGIDTWLDVTLEPGADWAQEIHLQLEQSDAVVAILSNASAKNSSVGYELGAARALNKRVVLIRQKDTTLRGPYSALSDVQTLDAEHMSADEIANTISAQLAA